jgi:hypothetical protein
MSTKKNAKDRAIDVVNAHKKAFAAEISLQNFLNACTSLNFPHGNEFRLIVKKTSPFRTEIEIISSVGEETYKAYVRDFDVFPSNAIDNLISILDKASGNKKPNV